MIRIVRSIVIPLILSFVSAEVAVRLAGVTPIPPYPADTGAWSKLYIDDQHLGWQNRPGVKQSFRIKGEPPFTITILEDGGRATSNPPASRRNVLRRDLIFVGCSFTQGFALNDEETYAWKVQAALPNWNVHNFGVNSYGTCQSYMLLERLFERERLYNPVVIYGFFDAHEDRNVADYLWHYALSTASSTGNISLPSCMLDSSGSIVFNELRPYPQFPLRQTLATIPIFEKLYAKLANASLASQKQRITEQSLIEMERLTAAQSGLFGVLFFYAGEGQSKHYQQFLGKRGTPVIALNPSDRNNIGPLTKRDGHPNGRMTDLISEKVVQFVASLGN
jgi:hypothetical protein